MLAILIRLAMLSGLSAAAPLAHAQLLTHRDELSPNFGDGVKDQAAAWA